MARIRDPLRERDCRLFEPYFKPGVAEEVWCLEASINTTNTNAIVIWIWNKGPMFISSSAWMYLLPVDSLAAVDEEGREFRVPFSPSCISTWKKTNFLYGWN